MKYPVFQTDILYDVRKGIHLVTTYYSDGSVEERLVPKSPLLIIDKWPILMWKIREK